MRSISGGLLQAQQRSGRVPIVTARMFRPGYPDDYFDLSRYIVALTLSRPPNMAPAALRLTLKNAGNEVSNSAYCKRDFVITLQMGYLVNGVADTVTMGTYYIDDPVRNFTINPPRNTVTISARDTFKVMSETRYEAGEWLSIKDITVQAAITQVVSRVTIAGVSPTVRFDTDAASVEALNHSLLEVTAAPQDQIDDTYKMFKAVISADQLQAYWDGDGVLRVGMMNDTLTVVGTAGGTRLARPIFGRLFKQESRDHVNVVHVEGDKVSADAYDPAGVNLIGRRKYLFIDDPEIDSTTTARRRAVQELNLAGRFLDQPDIVMPWQFDWDLRDIVRISDQQVSGLAPGLYRIEDMQYTYQSGTNPQATLSIGFGVPSVDASVSTVDYAFAPTATTDDYATKNVNTINIGLT